MAQNMVSGTKKRLRHIIPKNFNEMIFWKRPYEKYAGSFQFGHITQLCDFYCGSFILTHL